MMFNLRKFDRNSLGGVLIHMLIALGILVFLTLFYFYAYLPNTTNHGESVTVPDLSGKSVSELENFLAARDLRFEVSDSAYAEDAAPLSVIKQYPHPGSKVKEGRKIFVSINRINPPTVPVPDLVDGSLVNADAVLRSNQLRRGRITEVAGPFTNVVKDMMYKGQKITEGTRVPKGSVIDLVVMTNSGAMRMPKLTGLPFDEAKFMILGIELVLETIEGDSTDTDLVVIRQKPAVDQNIMPGDAVEIELGPREEPE